MTPIDWQVTLEFPFKLRVLPNLHVGKWEMARVVKETRLVVGRYLLAWATEFRRQWRVMEPNPLLRLRVLQERSGPQVLDDDNLTGSFKPVRDEIAAFFEINDGRTDRWVWLPCQQLVGDYRVRVHLSVVKVDAAAVGVSVATEGEKYPTIEQAIARAGGRQAIKRAKSRITPNVRKPR